ncbi:MAG: GHKL domain-containing protein, partial [Bacillota bacterium]
GLILCRIPPYFLVLILDNLKNIKRGESVPNSNWLAIVLIPATSLYLILLLFKARELSVGEVLAGVILILLVNFSTFYLYDTIIAALSDKMHSLLVLEQNKYYDRQLELMQASLQTTKAVKHDLKNHMFSIRMLIENDNKEETLKYLSNIMIDIGARTDYATSGNTIIDSIINFKFQEAEQKGIATSVELRIPEKLDIPSFDMTIILGNLLDNAIKAAVEVKEDRYINMKIKFDKGRLLIQADNPYSGVIHEKDGKILTSNQDKENHGIGLETVKKVIQKYDGIMNIDHSENVFSISLLMYVD